MLREPGYCLKWRPKENQTNLRARTDMLPFTHMYAVRPTFNHIDTLRHKHEPLIEHYLPVVFDGCNPAA